MKPEQIDGFMKDFLFIKCEPGEYIKAYNFRKGFDEFVGDIFGLPAIEKSLRRLGKLDKSIWVDGIRCYPNIQFKKENPTVRYNPRGFFEKIED